MAKSTATSQANGDVAKADAQDTNTPWWRDPGKRWIGVVLLLLLGNVAMVALLMVAAGPADKRRVLPNYYQRAATYDAEIAQRATNRQLGLQTTLVATSTSWRLDLRGPSGSVTDAKVALAIRHRSRPELDHAVTMTFGEGGYQAALPLPVGIYDVDLTIVMAGGKFVDHQEVEIKQ